MASWRAYAVIGLRYEQIARMELTKKQTTKYNPDTGLPYQITDTERNWYIGDNKADIGDREEVVSVIRTLLKAKGSKLPLPWGVVGEDNCVVGDVLENQDPEYYDSIGSYNMDELQKRMDAVKAVLAVLGVAIEPQIHFMSYCRA
jgi:hypothetical protein